MGAGAAWIVAGRADGAQLASVYEEIERRHDEGVARLQEWIRQPSIAAENRGMEEGCELMMRLLPEAGFQHVERRATDGQPGVFATLDAGAPRTVGLYFMYDVKQVDPAEWSSPPWDAAIVDKPGFGKVVMGRGAVNQKGPQAAFLAALHAIRGAGRKLPVNLVLVAEGEEEIGSPHFAQVVHAARGARRARDAAAASSCRRAAQDPDGSVTVSLGAKGVVELELVVERREVGPRPGEGRPLEQPRAPRQPGLPPRAGARHAGRRRRRSRRSTASPTPARPSRPREKAMLDAAAQRLDEATAKQLLSASSAGRTTPAGATRSSDLVFAPDREHRGAGRRLHRAGRQDGAAAPRGREARPAPGARHDASTAPSPRSRRTSRSAASATSR